MRIAGLCLAGLAVLALVVAVAFVTLPPRPASPGFSPASYDDLTAWPEADLTPTATAYARSCARILRAPADRPMGGDPLFGQVADWQDVCKDFLALDLAAIEDDALRRFFETHFLPLAVTAENGPEGLFTGYFEPEYPASLEKAPGYSVPLYTRPADLVTVNLGLFREEWKGRRLGGRVEGGQLKPFPDRAAIEDGVLDDTEVVAWLKDPVDAFFLHIQGSGLLKLADGTRLRVGYAAQNGRDYTAIGGILLDRGELTREAMSMQSIRQWLTANPDQAAAVMNRNKSYIFFRRVDGQGPIGSEGVPLTAGHSLAVDRSVFPMGVPVWLATTAPTADGSTTRPINRLMIAQDTGGAIKGTVRGDVFWGTGDEAGEIAGRMQNPGRIFVLVPRTLMETAR